MEVFAEKKAYITLKDHKPNFRTKPSCRLINPAKSEIGLISKQILEAINSRIRAATNLQQWRNTQSVIDCFVQLPSKENMHFTQFDIVDFYPSIKEDLLKKAIQFAKIHTTISEQEENIIWHARKSLLFDTSGARVSSMSPWDHMMEQRSANS